LVDTPEITIRSEQAADAALIRELLASAFGTAQEAALVDRLRQNGRLLLSLVAVSAAEIVGHIAFSEVTIADGTASEKGAGLAPLAVSPQWQKHGIGARLIRAGVTACEELGVGFMVVLGEPEYYRRFGFATASLRGLCNEYGADDAFMVLELSPGAMPAGLVRYAPEFAALEV
jgi:putative acetyltransferase